MVDAQMHPTESDAGAPGIKITPAMVDAGIEKLSRLDLEYDSAEQIVREVFLAMASAQDDAACRDSSNQQAN
jgi:hypothetical protein